jgi:hypothetical protein
MATRKNVKPKTMGRPKGKPRTEAEKAADARRTGRPVTISDVTVSKGVVMRLTPVELEQFKKDAKRLDMGLSVYMRYCWQTAREGKEYGDDISKSDPAKKSRNRKNGKRG